MSVPSPSAPAARLVARPPDPTEVGWHRLTALLVSVQLLLLVPFGALGFWLGLTLEWRSFVPGCVFVAAALAAWLYCARHPGRRPADWLVAESMLVLAFVVGTALIAGPSQYAAAALNRPVIDPWLLAADRLLGVDVRELVAWTAQQPYLVLALWLAYNAFVPQMSLAPLAFGLLLKDREALWEFAFHLHVTMFIAIAAFAVWPAACVFTTLGFDSLIDQTRFIDHFAGTRAGTLTVVSQDDLEGLVSCPSYHVAMAMAVTWVARRYRLLFLPLAVLNGALIAATVFLGAHYAIDVIASALIVVGSVLAYDRWGRALLDRRWLARPLTRHQGRQPDGSSDGLTARQ